VTGVSDTLRQSPTNITRRPRSKWDALAPLFRWLGGTAILFASVRAGAPGWLPWAVLGSVGILSAFIPDVGEAVADAIERGEHR
jgi:hypothetical protein